MLALLQTPDVAVLREWKVGDHRLNAMMLGVEEASAHRELEALAASCR
jgi:hypothetical protein